MSDLCDQTLTSSDVVIAAAWSDEAEDARGGGDGHTVNDIVLTGDRTVDLRAERLGSGNGRVYTLLLALTDKSGNTGNALHEVHVPKDIEEDPVAYDDGCAYVVGLPGCEDTDVFGGLIAMEEGGADPGSEATSMGSLPTEYALHQNHPNPFNPTTMITYDLPEDAAVRLVVFNMLGQEVVRLVDGQRAAGRHSVELDASGLPTGMYVYVLDTGSYQSSRKLVLVK